MAKRKYGKYVKKLTFKSEGPGFFRQITKLNGKSVGVNAQVEYGTYTAAGRMGKPPYRPHKHPFDQWIYLIGDSENFGDFDADIEMRLGDRILKINYPCYIFVPKNTLHCPLDIKRVGKPLIFIDASITQEASVRPDKVADVSRPTYIAKNNK